LSLLLLLLLLLMPPLLKVSRQAPWLRLLLCALVGESPAVSRHGGGSLPPRAAHAPCLLFPVPVLTLLLVASGAIAVGSQPVRCSQSGLSARLCLSPNFLAFSSAIIVA